MSSAPFDEPSFRVGVEKNDALSVMTRLRAAQAFESQEPTELDGAVEELIDRNLDPEKNDWSEVTRKVMRGVVESISDQEDADWAIRRASHRAVLAVAKRWGNIVMAGKATVVATQEAAGSAGLDSVKAAKQASLGAIEGVLQVGPVAYPVLQRELTPMVSDIDDVLAEERRSGEWMLRSLERKMELPVIPMEDEPEAVSLDLSRSDYEAVRTAPIQPVPAVELEEEDDELPPPPDRLPVPSPSQTPKVGFLQRVVNWFRGLFSGRDKKTGR